MARVEAVLFLASEPMNAAKIGRLASLADATEARTLVRRLNQFYDQAGSAFRAEEVAGGYQLRSRRKFGGWLRRLHQTPVEARLSSPALETLAVVAYRQPISRGAVEAIRGVQCGEMLRQLMERDLLKIVARSEELGRPYLYGTTQRFLQAFGLREIDDLPRAAEMRSDSPGDLQTPSTEHSSDLGRHDKTVSIQHLQEEPSVTAAIFEEQGTTSIDEQLDLLTRRQLIAVDEDEDEDDDLEDDDDDTDDDVEDDDEEEEEDEDFDDDFDDEDWEEVDDEDEEWDEEEDEDDEWDEDEDEDDDDDEEEEEWEEEA